MHNPPSPTATRRNKRLLIAFAALGIFVVALIVASAGGWAYFMFSGHDTAGLEGTWRNPQDPRHAYEFKSNGELANWNGSRTWWNRIDWSATWRRNGQHITIRTDRNWDMEGQLEGNTIRGNMLIRDENGTVETTVATVWQKE